MPLTVPKDLVFANSMLKVYYETEALSNQTESEIVICGTKGGFLSLANSLIYLLNDLKQTIPIHELSFVKTSLQLSLKIKLDYAGINGHVKKNGADEFLWYLSEDNAFLISTAIHSLGHLNPELHLDDEMDSDEISVYCVLDTV